jgi:hypothetical protein
MLTKKPSGLAITINTSGTVIPITETCPVILENIAGSRVRLAVEQSTVNCEISFSSTGDIIRKKLIHEDPESWALRNGTIATTLENLIMDLRVGMNGSL